MGKTSLAHALARSTDLSYRRIQLTSDLLPSDILGVSFLEQSSGDFKFKPGPIFRNILLADEINRATPKTQSALLEAMNEARAAVDSTSYDIPKPFMVIATQNPFEYKGTFPPTRKTAQQVRSQDQHRLSRQGKHKQILSETKPVNSRDGIKAVI